MIALSVIKISEAAQQAVLDVLRSGQVAQGPKVLEFEAAFADLVGVRHAVAVANGTVSLVAALRGLGIGPGDEVITSPFTFAATINAIIEVGASVRFADIDPDDFLLDAKATAAAIGPRTAALLPVHLYGQPTDMEAFAALAAEHGLAIVEDAAQAHGATVAGRGAGAHGVGSFSFYATKNMTTGEGGMVTTDDDAVADRLRVLRNQGMRARYEYEEPGYNLRMTDIQAAIGLAQLATIAEMNDRRQHNARRLDEGLAGLDGLITPVVRPGRTHVYHQYTIRVVDDAPIDRDALGCHLTEKGIGHGVYYPRLAFDYKCYLDHPLVEVPDVPNAQAAASSVLSLPVHPFLTESDLDQIIEAVRSAWVGGTGGSL